MCKVLKIVAVWGFGLAASLMASCTQVTVRPDSGSAVTVKPAGDGQLEVGVEGPAPKPEVKGAASAIDPSAAEARGAGLEGRIQHLEATRAALEAEVKRLGARKAEADKELVGRKEAVEAATRKLAELQKTLDEMTRKYDEDARTAKTLADQITAAEAGLATTEADRQRVEQRRDALNAQNNTLAEQARANADRLASAQKQLGETAKQLEALVGQTKAAEERRAAAEAAAEEAGTKAKHANGELEDVERRIKEASERLAAVTREVAEREQQAQRLAATQKDEARQPAPPAPTTTPDTAAAATPTRTPWPLVGVLAAIAIGAVAVVLVIRKPNVYAFTLRNEDSRTNHPIRLIARDSVDLSGPEPIKKAGGRNARGPFLTVNRKGQLVMHPAAGFPVKLGERPVNPAETPVVKAGTVLEVTGNGQPHRFLVGPVSVVEKNLKTVVKSRVATSVRPA